MYLSFKKHLKNPSKMKPKSIKIDSKNHLLFNIAFFRVWGSILGRLGRPSWLQKRLLGALGHLLAASWAPLGRLWGVSYVSELSKIAQECPKSVQEALQGSPKPHFTRVLGASQITKGLVGIREA